MLRHPATRVHGRRLRLSSLRPEEPESQHSTSLGDAQHSQTPLPHLLGLRQGTPPSQSHPTCILALADALHSPGESGLLASLFCATVRWDINIGHWRCSNVHWGRLSYSPVSAVYWSCWPGRCRSRARYCTQWTSFALLRPPQAEPRLSHRHQPPPRPQQRRHPEQLGDLSGAAPPPTDQAHGTRPAWARQPCAAHDRTRRAALLAMWDSGLLRR